MTAKRVLAAVIPILFVLSFPKAGITRQETPHPAFVSEYIRELGANESLQALWEKEVASEQDNGRRFAASIRGITRITLELTFQIKVLQRMHLNDPFDTLIDTIVKAYQRKIELYDRFIQITTAFISGVPKPGVDYDALAADAPKITAEVEYIDRTLMQATPAIFATLIDMKPDRQGNVSHLVITRVERDKLVRSLQLSFGKKADQDDQNLIVSSASVLRDYLAKKGFKCSDELM